MYKKIINIIITIYFSPLLLLVLINKKLNLAVAGALTKRISKITENYIILKELPRKTSAIVKWKDAYNTPSFCIIIQGQIILEDNFTLNSVKIYKNYFPQAMIIVSTWENTNEDCFLELEKAGAILVISKKPDSPGCLNINYQIISTIAGLNEARNSGIEVVIKTRSDQRYTNVTQLNYLYNKIKKQESNKIYLLGEVTNSFYSLPYHLSDFFCAGKIENVINYFDVKLDERPYAYKIDILKVFSKEILEVDAAEINYRKADITNMKMGEFLKELSSPEQIFYLNYIKKQNFECDNSDYHTHYIKTLFKFIEIIDSTELGFYWFKGSFKYHSYSILENSKRIGRLNKAQWSMINE